MILPFCAGLLIGAWLTLAACCWADDLPPHPED
jgi:hypothetical protein